MTRAELSRRLSSAALRRELQPRLLEHAVQLLQGIAELEGQGSRIVEVTRERAPSKLELGERPARRQRPPRKSRGR